MALDPSSALADKYRDNRKVLEAAVLGKSDASIDPYSALRALQKLNVADKYAQMQQAMQGQPNPPSIAEQTVAQAQQPAGLGGMPVPEETFGMAGGGIVSFATGNEVGDIQSTSTTSLRTEVDPEDMAAYLAAMKEYGDPDAYYGAARDKLAALRTKGPEYMEQQKGLAALQAAAAMAQGDSFIGGLGGALGAFGQTYGAAKSESEEQDRLLSQMELEVQNQQRQEAMGNYKDARASAERALSLKNEATKYASEEAYKDKTLGLKEREIGATLAAAQARTKDPSDRMQMYAINYGNAAIKLAQKGPRVGETEDAFKQRIEHEASQEAATETANQWRDAGAVESDVQMFKTFMANFQELDKDLAQRKITPEEYAKTRAFYENNINTLIHRMPAMKAQTTGLAELPSRYVLQ